MIISGIIPQSEMKTWIRLLNSKERCLRWVRRVISTELFLFSVSLASCVKRINLYGFLTRGLWQVRLRIRCHFLKPFAWRTEDREGVHWPLHVIGDVLREKLEPNINARCRVWVKVLVALNCWRVVGVLYQRVSVDLRVEPAVFLWFLRDAA